MEACPAFLSKERGRLTARVVSIDQPSASCMADLISLTSAHVLTLTLTRLTNASLNPHPSPDLNKYQPEY